MCAASLPSVCERDLFPNKAYVFISSPPFYLAQQPPVGQGSTFTKFLDHIQRRTTVGRTPLDEGSARRRDLYLTAYNTHNRQTSILPVGFEPTIPASERPQTYTLDRTATGTGLLYV